MPSRNAPKIPCLCAECVFEVDIKLEKKLFESIRKSDIEILIICELVTDNNFFNILLQMEQ